MIDASLASFERDVIEASMEVPVVVHFWAPWCVPTKALASVLERLEREHGGRFKLVNVNSDANPELVASFNLKSIPYAAAFVDGHAVAQFMGAQPERYVRAFLDRIIPDPADLEHRSARDALARGLPAIAEEYLKNAIALDPANDGARLDMIALLLDRDDVPRARAHFGLLSPRAATQVTQAVVAARMAAAEVALTLPPAELLERRIRFTPSDLEARLDLAELHIARRQFGPALEQLLEIARRDRTFRNDIGRLKMLEVFAIAADQVDLVADYRTRLSAVLF